MINSWDFHNLNIDFSSMFDGNDHPSDIDMFYLCRDNTLIVGEIKNAKGEFKDGQRRMMTRLLNSHKGDAVGLYITHDGFVQKGAKMVDVSRCPVREIYVKGEGKWRFPKHEITVREVIDYYKRRNDEQ